MALLKYPAVVKESSRNQGTFNLKILGSLSTGKKNK